MNTIKNSINVIARFKPPLESENIQLSSTSVCIDNKTFNLDGVAPPSTTQEEFYETYIKNHILKVETGINSTIMCYGFTGAGKTYTLFGTNDCVDSDDKPFSDTGIVTRSILSIFELLKQKTNNDKSLNYSLNLTMVEIYMEKIYDLIDPNNIFIGVSGSTGLIGASKKYISTEKELINLISKASYHRKTQDTKLNSLSSRSHCIIIIQIKKYSENGNETCGNLYLVDLAGCERLSSFNTSETDENIKRIIKKKTIVEKLRFGETITSEINKSISDESRNINKSIFSLNNVVTACSTGQKFIPYRNSKLTMVLKNAIGGNSNTLVTVCCSNNINETLMTLQFGSRCNKIKNNIKNNIVEKDTRDLLILKLRSEIIDLKSLLEISKQKMSEERPVNPTFKYPFVQENNSVPETEVGEDSFKFNCAADFIQTNSSFEYDQINCDKLVNNIFGHLLNSEQLDTDCTLGQSGRDTVLTDENKEADADLSSAVGDVSVDRSEVDGPKDAGFSEVDRSNKGLSDLEGLPIVDKVFFSCCSKIKLKKQKNNSLGQQSSTQNLSDMQTEAVCDSVKQVAEELGTAIGDREAASTFGSDSRGSAVGDLDLGEAGRRAVEEAASEGGDAVTQAVEQSAEELGTAIGDLDLGEAGRRAVEEAASFVGDLGEAAARGCDAVTQAAEQSLAAAASGCEAVIQAASFVQMVEKVKFSCCK